jgi:hypothetical protein
VRDDDDDDDKYIILGWTFVKDCGKIVISKTTIFYIFYYNIIFNELMEFDI